MADCTALDAANFISSFVEQAEVFSGLPTHYQDALNDASFYCRLREYVIEDVIPCLTPSPLDLAKYRDVVLERFSNPYIQDKNQRVAADGFSKIPGFIAPTLAQRIAAGATPAATAMLPALFLRFLQRWSQGTLPYPYQDGVMDGKAVKAMFASSDPLAVFCADKLLWGSLAGSAPLANALRDALARVDAWLAKRGCSV